MAKPEPTQPTRFRLHNAMWPGLVGKGPDAGEPAIDLATMLRLTAGARVDGRGFDGVDLFLYDPHTSIDASDDELRRVADLIGGHGFSVGSVVAPVWFDASAMGPPEKRDRFVDAVRKACRIARWLDDAGLRKYGIVRIDSAAGVADWATDPAGNQEQIASTFRRAADVAADHGQRLAAEGEICWGGMHGWKDMLRLLEMTDRPGLVGFQADLAHTYLYLLGYNAPEQGLLKAGYSGEQFWLAYRQMTDALRPWTLDFHVAQNDGTVHGSGSHDKTGRHCPADDPQGKLDVVACSEYWLWGAADRGIRHLCWDGCMFPNATLLRPETWNQVLALMLRVQERMAGAVKDERVETSAAGGPD